MANSEEPGIFTNYLSATLLTTMVPRILFVYTSANKLISRSRQTVSSSIQHHEYIDIDTSIQGYWLSEAAHPYYTLVPKFEIDFASPKKTFPVDTDSVTVGSILSVF